MANFFERIAPLIEVVSFYFIFLVMNNSVKWDYAIAFMVMAYLFTVFFSIVTIVIEHTYHQYTKRYWIKVT
jgi:hypothetical protein